MSKPFAQSYPRSRASVRGKEGKCRARTTLHDPYFSFVTFLFFLTAFALFAPLTAAASDPFTGKITSIDSGESPQVLNIVRPGKSGLPQAKPGDAVFVGDTVKTGPGVKAQIELSDKSLINIGPNSTFRVKAYVLSPAEAKRNYVLKALKGTIRFIISKVFKAGSAGAESSWKDSSVTVETSTAIAGVRGTDFVVIVDAGNPAPVIDIAVFEGPVTVRNSSLSIREAVTLEANQVSSVQRGLKPAQPSVLSQERRDALTRLTTPGAIKPPAGKASAEAQNKSAGAADMARDIAAGMPLAEVFDRAAASGMTVSQMVAAAIEAGVESHVVVYAAITGGYPARAVVAGAVDDGAPLYDVIAAAVAAGAERKDIIDGATSAGALPENVATAFALASTNSAPMYGYILPVSPTPETIIPETQIVIGGGGGVTPSTLPASPFKP